MTHRTMIIDAFLSEYYEVTCSCGFEVKNLTTHEAAMDTAKRHNGFPIADPPRTDIGETGG